MEILLNKKQKAALEARHKTERDSRVCDRIKAVLLKSENWTDQSIAQALRIHEETVRVHLKDWQEEAKLKPENGGSTSKLSAAQSEALEKHLQEKIYLQASETAIPGE